jgi:hypothetical protein
MLPFFSSSHRRSLGQSGTTSLEFALIAAPFFFVLIAGTDLGRYFLTQHSMRTLTSEAARSAVVNCFGVATWCVPSMAVPSPSTVWAKVPFLDSAAPGASLTAEQTTNLAGVRTISVTAHYPFEAICPGLSGLSGTIAETTKLEY